MRWNRPTSTNVGCLTRDSAIRNEKESTDSPLSTAARRKWKTQEFKLLRPWTKSTGWYRTRGVPGGAKMALLSLQWKVA